MVLIHSTSNNACIRGGIVLREGEGGEGGDTHT